MYVCVCECVIALRQRAWRVRTSNALAFGIQDESGWMCALKYSMEMKTSFGGQVMAGAVRSATDIFGGRRSNGTRSNETLRNWFCAVFRSILTFQRNYNQRLNKLTNEL